MQKKNVLFSNTRNAGTLLLLIAEYQYFRTK